MHSFGPLQGFPKQGPVADQDLAGEVDLGEAAHKVEISLELVLGVLQGPFGGVVNEAGLKEQLLLGPLGVVAGLEDVVLHEDINTKKTASTDCR